jgi:putative thioredoxin
VKLTLAAVFDAATIDHVDVSELDFESAVIERSRTVPVVVDFWAEWCGPCRQLGPILERAVAAREGKVELAKVDVDANPRLAQAFRIQGIPAVKAFRDGELVAEFVGAQGLPAVERFLDSLLPSEADRLIDLGDEASLRRALELEPGRADAALPLARLLHDGGQDDEALEVLRSVPGSFAAAGLAARIELERDTASSDQRASLSEAFAALDSGERERAIEVLMQALAADGAANGSREQLRRIVVGVLDELGVEDPLARATRRQLASLLY